tara:strand:+ start:114 stop:335 length:222 start_codon:yes stop_codon:yes gene_type:complete
MNTLFKDVRHVMGKIKTFGRNSWCIAMPRIILAIVGADAIATASFIFTESGSGQSVWFYLSYLRKLLTNTLYG